MRGSNCSVDAVKVYITFFSPQEPLHTQKRLVAKMTRRFIIKLNLYSIKSSCVELVVRPSFGEVRRVYRAQ